MTDFSQPPVFYIGWDVGGWNCDKNPASRDAIVILDSDLKIVGAPWRGNLRTTINDVQNCEEWVARLFTLCKANPPVFPIRAVIAIDTPLGFPECLQELITGTSVVSELEDSSSNPYLFRVTEQFLFEQGITPLSSVKDMIGSQATKGIHLISKLRFDHIHCGLWVHEGWFATIETYPSPCRNSLLVKDLRKSYAIDGEEGKKQGLLGINHEDKSDALTCALIAYCFDARVSDLVGPIESAPTNEGWIWLPRDVLPLADTYRGEWRFTTHINLKGEEE